MSAGSGFHSITGDWQFKNYSQTGIWEQGRHAGKKKYKSRKIAEWNGYLSLMGFVKLRYILPEEIERQEMAVKSQEKIKARILSNNSVDSGSICFSIGEIVDAVCTDCKKVKIEGVPYDIQLVLPKGTDPEHFVDNIVKVRIKQISKVGKICQVEYVE